MNKKCNLIGIIAIIIGLIVIGPIIFSSIFEPPTTPSGDVVLNIREYDIPEISMDVSKDQQLKERYIRQTYLLSQALSGMDEIDVLDTDLNRLDKLSTAVYSGSVIAQSLKFNNIIIRTGTSGFSKIYNLRIIEREVNNIIPLHNNVIKSSKIYRKDASLEKTNDYLDLVGEHAGKTMYIALRSDAKAAAAFIDGLIKISSKAGIKMKEGKIKDACGKECFTFYSNTCFYIICQHTFLPCFYIINYFVNNSRPARYCLETTSLTAAAYRTIFIN